MSFYYGSFVMKGYPKFVNSVKAKYRKTKVISGLTQQGNRFHRVTLQIIKGDTGQKMWTVKTPSRYAWLRFMPSDLVSVPLGNCDVEICRFVAFGSNAYYLFAH